MIALANIAAGYSTGGGPLPKPQLWRHRKKNPRRFVAGGLGCSDFAGCTAWFEGYFSVNVMLWPGAIGFPDTFNGLKGEFASPGTGMATPFNCSSAVWLAWHWADLRHAGSLGGTSPSM